MIGTRIPFEVYPARRVSLRTAEHYAPWIALAYAILGREDQASEILTRLRELHEKNGIRIGPTKRTLAAHLISLPPRGQTEPEKNYRAG